MDDAMINWTRAAVVGALVGATFWAMAAYGVLASEGSTVVAAAICCTALFTILIGAVLYRRPASENTRSFGVGLILAPLTGLATIIVFCPVALIFQLITDRGW